MKKSRLALTAVIVAQLTAACAARAQLPPFDHRPTADTITSAIQELGAVGPWSDHADFQGCPETDPLGPDLILGLDPTVVSDRTTAELAYLWSDELATCGSSALEGWYSATISHGVTTESSYMGDILVHLPTPLPAQLSADLTTLAAQSSTPEWIRADLLTALSVSTSGSDRLDVFFTNAAAVDPPESWLLFEANFLMRDDEAGYLSRVASEASGLSDRGLSTALAPVGAAIAAGNLDVADTNVQTILQALENRPALATVASYIAGDPLFDALPEWTAGEHYSVGEEVSFQGLDYRCRQSHTSQSDWEPPNVYALWERINTGGEWAPQVIYQTGDETIYQGTTYRAIQGHQSQTGWEPPNQPALWGLAN